MTISRSGTAPLGSSTAPLRRLPQTGAAPKGSTGTRDTLTISRTATARLNEAPAGAQVFEGKALFDTARDNVTKGNAAGLDKTLDSFIEAFKKLSPEQQQAMLADPGFKIVVEGHASNLGNASRYDNSGLSQRRASNTAKYVEEYLDKRGVGVKASQIQAEGQGTPGAPKKVDNNDQEDRSSNVKIVMPPPKEPEAPKPPAAAEQPAPPAPAPPPAPPAPAPTAGGPTSRIVFGPPEGEDEEDKERRKQVPRPAPLPDIPMGGWERPKSDESYVAPKDPYSGVDVGPGYVRPANWNIDR